MMKKLQKQAGFTLIELVIVIVILGILAATAAPKFIDLTNDAKASVMEGLEGALNSAADLAHAKALVEGKTATSGSTQSISVGSDTILLNYGWPITADISKLVDVDSAISHSGGTFFYVDSTSTQECAVTYSNVASNTETRPTIATVDLTKC
jgi:MSHA pilin protein MshA